MTAETPGRPLGVTVLAVLAGIIGALGLFGGLVAVRYSGAAEALAGGQAGVGSIVALAGLLTIVLGILYLAFAVGAWRLRPWAWWLGMLAAVAGIVLVVVDISAGSQDTVGAVVDVAIGAAILYYLTRPEIRRAFGRPSPG